MVARLFAVLAVLAGGLVLGSAAPAAACSCARLSPQQYADRADVAFVGTATSERAADGALVYRFTVDTVHAGRVSRTQDVVAPRTGSTCDQRLPLDRELLVLASVDARGRLSLQDCQDAGWDAEGAFAGKLTAVLGPGTPPLPGRSEVEAEGTAMPDLLWSALAIGVVGALGLVVVRRLARPSGRG
ncbi:hypothetical protein ACNKF0_00645 [Nocardioides sp. T5]|uniref:hypothetical protein n=1 Tax=Nocardioides sp. T5 TaxID=3400182 RepID=UPI003A850363